MNTRDIQTSFRHAMSDPLIDWGIILAISATAALILVALGVYVYLGVESQLDAPAAPIAPAHAAFDPALLSSVMSDADMRAAIMTDRALHYPVAPDPSLP